jgi:hypothetical protein
MIRLIRNRRALSTVITTLIILVVSILLASVLTYFATNVVSTRVQEESLHLTKQHVWVDSAGVAQGAIMVTNNGGRDVVISKLTVRGQTSDWADVKYLVATTSDTGLLADLSNLPSANMTSGIVTGFADTLATATGSLVLPSGSTMVIYISSPDSLTLNDVGLTISIAIHSAQAVYYCEVNVQAYIPAP